MKRSIIAVTPLGRFESKESDFSDQEVKDTEKFLKDVAATGNYMSFEDKRGDIIVLARETLRNSIFMLVKCL